MCAIVRIVADDAVPSCGTILVENTVVAGVNILAVDVVPLVACVTNYCTVIPSDWLVTGSTWV